MTPERLRTLLATGECLTIEFKGEGARPFSDRELVEAVVCLANRPVDDPAWLIVGVEDDGAITGARPRHEAGQTDPHRVQALLANRTRPSLPCHAEIVHLQEQPLLVIEVPSARTPVGTVDGKYLRRALTAHGHPECIPFHFHEMVARQIDHRLLDNMSATVQDAQWEDLDPLEFERFRRCIQENPGQGDANLLTLSDLELAKALGAVTANHTVSAIRVLGLLLFGKEAALRRLLPTHEVAFQVLVGAQVMVNDFFRWPLLRVIDELLTRFRARREEEELLVGMQRIGVPNYSERAYREAVANALIHRDYTRLGAVHIQWREDRLEISNPGGFPEGVRLDNVLVTPPRPRNPLLADACKRAGIVERTARGIDLLFEEQLRNGRSVPTYERSTERDVVVVIPGGKPNFLFVRLIVEERNAGHALSLDELLLLDQLSRERLIVVADAARCLQKSEDETRLVLEKLRAAGIIEGQGKRFESTYVRSTTTARRLEIKDAVHGVSRQAPLEFAQQVLTYVHVHGRITRQQAAALCGLSPFQASRLLTRLVKTGELLAHGSGRGVWYSTRS